MSTPELAIAGVLASETRMVSTPGVSMSRAMLSDVQNIMEKIRDDLSIRLAGKRSLRAYRLSFSGVVQRFVTVIFMDLITKHII